MVQNKTTALEQQQQQQQQQQQREEEALLRGRTHFYESKGNGNKDSVTQNRTPSLADDLDNKSNFERKPSRLEWAQSSWTRFPHILFWWWLNPILNLGYKKILTDDDLEDLAHEDKCTILARKLLIYDWSSTATWRIVLHAFGKSTLYTGLILFPHIAARIAQPLFLRAIVEIVIDDYHTSQYIVNDILLAIGLFLSSIAQAFCYHHYLFLSTKLGIRIRNALSSTIYRHLLTINVSSLQQTTSAQAISLVANDTSKFEDLWIFVHFLWAAPLEAIIVFSILLWIIGFLPTVFAFFILLLIVLVQSIFGRCFGHYHQQTMSYADKRIKAYNEFLDGCHIIKMYNWEKPMEERVCAIRAEELTSIGQANRLRAFNMTLFFVSPCLMALVAFGGVWLLNFPFKSADVFTALVYFSQIRLPVTNFMPLAMERLSAMLVASKRIDAFMRLKIKQSHKQQSRTSRDKNRNDKSGAIIMHNVSLSWGDNNPCLSSLTVDIKPGQLVGIAGTVGAGKSSLLAAVLGEMNLTSGNIQVDGSLSYAAQSVWIFADTLRANILFGKEFNEERYRCVLRACCLDVDLKAFGQASDLIIIGEKGVNLSGGQKARVSLARALYTDADIYLLDDPLSAVDPRVAERIYNNCIGSQGLLKGKTRLLVTHQTHFLTSSDRFILLVDGHIAKNGPFHQLSTGREHMNAVYIDTKTDKEANNTQEITAEDLDVGKSAAADTQSILHDEIPVSGSVNWSVCRRLFTASPLGWYGLILLIIALLVGEAFYDITICWLAIWLQKPYAIEQRVTSFAYIYLALTLGTIITAFMRVYYWFYIILRGSANQHYRMLNSILYTSMRFFESNSVGRILNRASRDQYVVDELLPMTMFDAVQSLLIMIGSLIIIIVINPLVVILMITVLPICWYLVRYYSRSYRQLKRLESVTRSPIYALFSSSVNGLTTIRAFKMKGDFLQTYINRVDANTRAYIPLISGIYWFGLRLDFIASTFVLMTAILCVIMSNRINASMVALSLMCSLNIVSRLQWCMRQFVETGNLMTSAERIDEYTHLPLEEDNGGDKELTQLPSDWPNRGSIEFRNYTLRYRPELEPVLKNLDIYINPNEKIGIIGRTGAGKSSLFQAIFRLVERSAVDGEIFIDGIDISRVTLHRLRSHLSIIPQMPILFSDTLRYNLDPFQIYTDEDCLKALEAVQLKHRVREHPDGLYLPIAEFGSNLSVGECQLICVARAILKQTKILLIDEATANIDHQTDAVIQAVMKDKFRDRTILTIAHRLNTITNSDRILVLEKGRVVDFDIVENILQQ